MSTSADRLEDPILLGRVVTEIADESALDPTGTRYDVVRTGERDPIDPMIRLLVWLRDQGTCRLCHSTDRRIMELDHIVPWSAGGPDSASNLRVTCQPCNQARSNFRDWGGPRLRPKVTPACDRCVETHGDRAGSRWWHKRHELIAARTGTGMCPACLPDDVRIGEWNPPEIAWCGLCEALSAVTGPGRVL